MRFVGGIRVTGIQSDDTGGSDGEDRNERENGER